MGPFFVAGGTLPAGAASYVERAADRGLFEALYAGKFCYVLNSRQMGKSSLCVRTMQRLEAAAVRTAFVDLTRIGGKNVTPEQWYAGIAIEIGRSLGVRNELLGFWKNNDHLGPLQRLFASLREVVLTRIEGPVAIFLDEIDATRSLSFSADEFFAAIRECYNRRVQDPEFSRLTFCLLGVAVPSDLINNPASTPFNVGERIHLRDFTLEEAMGLTGGLSMPNAREIVERVFYWTNGHPYLTQSLCAAIAVGHPSGESSATAVPSARRSGLAGDDGWTIQDVDALVRRDLFESNARETNINLADVGNRVLHAGDLEPEPEKFRADLLSAYERVWRGGTLEDEESNRVVALLKLSGVMRTEGSRLKVRNRIYHHVFDRTWIHDNMPRQELRRQRRAFYLGVARTAAIASVVVGGFGWLALTNARLALRNAVLARDAQQQGDRAEYRAYVSSVNLMQAAYTNNDLMQLDRLLRQTATSPFRNFEWRYWLGMLNDTSRRVALPAGIGSLVVAQDGKSFAVTDSQALKGAVYSLPDLKVLVGPVDVSRNEQIAEAAGRWAAVGGDVHVVASARDLDSRKLLGELKASSGVPNYSALSPNSRYFVSVFSPGKRIEVWDVAHYRRIDAFHVPTPLGTSSCAISGDGRLVAWTFDPLTSHATTVVFDRSARRVVDRFVGPYSSANFPALSFTNDGKYLAVGYPSGDAWVRDVGARRTIFNRVTSSRAVRSATISWDGRRLLTVGTDLAAKVWDVATGALLQERKGAMNAGLTRDGAWLIVCGDGTRVYPVSALAAPVTAAGSVQVVEGLDSDSLVAVTLKGVNFLDPLPPFRVIRKGMKGETHWTFIPSNPDCALRYLPSGHSEIVRTSDGVAIGRVPGVDFSGYDVARSGERIAVCHGWHRLEAYDLAGKPLWQQEVANGVSILRWSQDASRIAIGTADGSINLVEGRTGRTLRTFTRNSTTVRCLAFSHDGRRLAAGDDNRSIFIFDLTGNAPPVEATAHTGSVYSVDFSPDDTRLVSGSFDGTVRVWDPATGEPLLRLGDGLAQLWSVFFNAAGDRIYTSDLTFRIASYCAPKIEAKSP